MQSINDQIEALGASFVALTPQSPEKNQAMIDKNDLSFDLLHDIGNGYANQLGLRFTVPLPDQEVYSEFVGRHELYDCNYAGSNEMVCFQTFFNTRGLGALDQMVGLAEQCMAEYCENGWVDEDYFNPGDVGGIGYPKEWPPHPLHPAVGVLQKNH